MPSAARGGEGTGAKHQQSKTIEKEIQHEIQNIDSSYRDDVRCAGDPASDCRTGKTPQQAKAPPLQAHRLGDVRWSPKLREYSPVELRPGAKQWRRSHRLGGYIRSRPISELLLQPGLFHLPRVPVA